jgi:hypothetical protein
MRRFIWVLKSSPAADVIDKDCFELCIAAHDILDQSGKACPMFDDYPTSPSVGIYMPDDEPVLCCVSLNFDFLIGDLKLLVFR